jgi:hypothetical protein
LFSREWRAIKDSVPKQDFNVNLNNLKSLSKLYENFTEKDRPYIWVQWCVERVLAYVEELNNGRQ